MQKEKFYSLVEDNIVEREIPVFYHSIDPSLPKI
jgi:hypothetical protein